MNDLPDAFGPVQLGGDVLRLSAGRSQICALLEGDVGLASQSNTGNTEIECG